MYVTPYRLPAIQNALINGDAYSNKKEINEEDGYVKYTFCLAQDGRQEDKPQHKVTAHLCPEDKLELEIFLTTSYFKVPLENTSAEIPQLYVPNSTELWQAKQYLLELHNQARDNYGDGSNLMYDMVVNNIAQSYAEYIALNDDMGHVTTSQETLEMRFKKHGYIQGLSYTSCGENVALATYTGDLKKDVAYLFQLWKTSQSHWDNLLDINWEYVGFGIAIDINLNIIYGVVNFMYGGTRERVGVGSEPESYLDYIGREAKYKLNIRSQEINSNHTLDNVPSDKNINLIFEWEAPEIPALTYLILGNWYQSTTNLMNKVKDYIGYGQGIIGKNKKDALRIAGKKYTFTVVDWDTFQWHAPGGLYLIGFNLDTYAGQYPYQYLTLPLCMYGAEYLELFGLTGGRIVDKRLDIGGQYYYNVRYKCDILYNVKAIDNLEWDVDDYVLLSKTSKDFSSNNENFDFIGRGRDNSPAGFRGYVHYPLFANQPYRTLDSKEVNSIDEDRDEYYIIPADPFELPSVFR